MSVMHPRIALPVQPGAKIENYLRALMRLGAVGTAIHEPAEAGEWDGLLLPGGWDADPALYGQENRACEGVDRALDGLQLESLDRFARAKKPVLGICRGAQMINVCFGGSLIQHLPTSHLHSRDAGSAEDKVHMTRAAAGSFAHALYGPRFSVNSSHHQAVDRLGTGLRAVQWSDEGVIEGIEHETLPVWGVQWHPERMCFEHSRADTVDGSKIIAIFLMKCGGGE